MNFSALIAFLSEWLGVIAILMMVARLAPIQPRPVRFQYIEREKWVSFGLFVLMMVFSIAIFSSSLSSNFAALTRLQMRLVLALGSMLLVVVALLVRRQPLLSVGWRKSSLKMAFRLGLPLVFLSVILRGKTFAMLNGITPDEGLALLLLTLICTAEESIFRGFLQLRLGDGFGERYGWLITALLFVLWQVPRLLLDPAGFWVQLLILLVQSLLAGWIMRYSGHVAAGALYRIVSEWLTMLS